MQNDLDKLNDILFETLDKVKNMKNDENKEFNRIQAELVFNVADRIIKGQELELKNQIWKVTRQSRFTNNNPLAIGCSD